MAYRNGTYIAFDGLGKADPSESDYKYYSIIQAWAKNKNIEFQITNSHEKSNAVRDTSQDATLKKAINTRLANSKNMLIILSDNTRRTGSYLSYEIERAIDYYEIPLIIAYIGHEKVHEPLNLSRHWPYVLEDRIIQNKYQELVKRNSSAKIASAIHIPYKKNAILTAIKQFDINNMPDFPDTYYIQENWD